MQVDVVVVAVPVTGRATTSRSWSTEVAGGDVTGATVLVGTVVVVGSGAEASNSGPALASVKAGAIDYITKPVRKEHLELAVQQALEFARLRRENAQLREEVIQVRSAREIIGQSEALRRILDTVKVVAPTRAAVLLQGESGTGKELLARNIPYLSNRADGPFITMNCAATFASARSLTMSIRSTSFNCTAPLTTWSGTISVATQKKLPPWTSATRFPPPCGPYSKTAPPRRATWLLSAWPSHCWVTDRGQKVKRRGNHSKPAITF